VSGNGSVRSSGSSERSWKGIPLPATPANRWTAAILRNLQTPNKSWRN